MINAEELLKLVTKQDVIEILTDSGSDTPKPDKNNLYFTTICHHGNSKKLHYFSESGFFHCYTSCGSMSLYDLLMSVNNWTFLEAFRFVADYKGVNLYKRHVGLKRKEYKNEDLEFLNRHLNKGKEKKEIVLPSYDEKILGMFDNYYPEQWYSENISEEVAKYYGIRFYFAQGKAIIPHYDVNHRLIGLRGRSFLQQDLDAGKKYMPITIQGLTYKFPVQFNLFGLTQNHQNIKRFKRAILFESEKSVMLYSSYFGNMNNISVATLGMNLSLYQRDLLLNCGIEELIIAFDKQYEIEALEKEDKNSIEYKEYVKYIKTLIKITKMFLNYCSVYIVLCWNERIGYKQAPIDCGKETFEELMREKYLVESVEDLEELIE